jgi:hypothetical protein
MLAPEGQAIEILVLLFTKATLPKVADMAIDPTASAVGTLLMPVELPLSTIRKYLPGWMIAPGSISVVVQLVPVAEVY